MAECYNFVAVQSAGKIILPWIVCRLQLCFRMVCTVNVQISLNSYIISSLERTAYMVTLKEIAQECNVSATTVSNILNGKAKASEETKRLVLQKVKETGYRPNYIAQGLRTQKTRMIGIVAEDIAQFTTPAIIEGIMAHTEEKGYRTTVYNLRMYARWQDTWYEKDKQFHSIVDPVIQELLSVKVDGVIYVAGHARIIKCFPEDFAIPAVMAYAYSDSPEIPSIVVNEEASSLQLVKYLTSMGHERIGVICGRADNIHTQKRLLGYQKALYEGNILFNPELVRYGDWERNSGYREAAYLVKAGVTAIYTMADRMAGGVYDYLEEHGLKAGEDISVASFDNQDIAEYFRPALTTMDLPLEKIGQQASELLFEKLDSEKSEGKEEGRKLEIEVPCELVIRNSVKRLDR